MSGRRDDGAGTVTATEAEAVEAGAALEAAIVARQRELLQQGIWGDLTGARFAVLGLGVSGVAAANALASRGADVQAWDDKAEDDLLGPLARLDRRVRARCGTAYVARPGEIAIVSPGLSVFGATFRRVAASALAVLGEIELFYRLDRASNHGLGHPIVAITGTDGKTTTTMLVDHLLRASGHTTLLAGNIGDPLCSFVDTLGPDCVVVAEVSEFQLATTVLFRPRVLVLTNVADDHLDWFANDRAAYIASMVDPALRMGPGDRVVVSAHDPAFAMLRTSLANRLPRGAGLALCSARLDLTERGFALPTTACAADTDEDAPEPADPGDRLTSDLHGAWYWGVRDGVLRSLPAPDVDWALARTDELGVDADRPMLGVHNLDNALCAAAAVVAFGVPPAGLRAALRSFKLPSHRLEPAGGIGAVRFIDDSKATNPHAAIHGLRAIDLAPGETLAWIGGGSEKDGEFDTIADEVVARATVAVLIGATAPRIEKALLAAGMDPGRIVHASQLQDAVAVGWQHVAGADRSGAGVVVLTPACASFGMFRNYAHRGEVFHEAVQRLSLAVLGPPASVIGEIARGPSPSLG